MVKSKKLKITIKRFPSGAYSIGLNRRFENREEEQQLVDLLNKECRHVLKVDEDEY